MARFRKRSRARRSFARPARRSGSRNKSNGGSLLITAAGAGIYGAGREKISNLLQPVIGMLPLGNIADEVALGAAGYYVAKKSNMPILKSIGRAALTIEAARIGQAIVDGQVSLGGSSQSSVQPFVLGR